MGDSSRSPTQTSTSASKYYNTLGLPKTATLKDITKAYKSLVMKWHPDRNKCNKAEAEAKFTSINEAYRALSKKNEGNLLFKDLPKTPSHRHCDEDGFCISSPRLISTTSTRISAPASTPQEFSKSTSRRSKTPTPLSSTRDFFASSPINLSGKAATAPAAPTTSRSGEAKATTAQATPTTSRGGEAKATTAPATPTTSRGEEATLSKMTSRRGGPTPIIFSHSTSTTLRKPPAIEKKLKCALEELCQGCVKKIKITRNVVSHFGIIVQEEELLTIKVKPGWKKGTKITFEGKGDERPGTLPADIIFIIDEKRHPLFKRDGNDLHLGVEVPLVQALTGCTITAPLLGGDDMTLTIDDIIYPGFEKIIPGQGMPIPKKEGRRGNLRLKFLVKFPKKLSDEQRADIVSILEDGDDS